MCNIIMAVIIMATMCTKHVASSEWVSGVPRALEVSASARLTWLEYEGPAQVDIAAIAGGLYALLCAHQRTDDECCGLADLVE
jgi:hypothetical protein